MARRGCLSRKELRGRGGQRAHTESHEETNRLLEVGANRSQDAMPTVASTTGSSPSTGLERDTPPRQAIRGVGTAGPGSGGLQNSNQKN